MESLSGAASPPLDNLASDACSYCAAPGSDLVQIFYPGVGGLPEPLHVCADCQLDASLIFGAVVAKVLRPNPVMAKVDGLDSALQHGGALLESGIFWRGA